MINEELLTELIDLGERLSEDRLYEVVIDEIERDEFDSVAKAKALEEAEGDQNKARAFYTKHRVRRIRDLIAEAEIAAEAEKMRAEEELKRQEAELQQQRADQQAAKERAQAEREMKIKQDAQHELGKSVGVIIYATIGIIVLIPLIMGMLG